MNYIVLDLEWNQGSEKTLRPDIPFEIIEIGAVKLDSERNITDTFSSFIKPQIYKRIHFMTEKVIHLKAKDLEGAEHFNTVMKRFLSWCGEDYTFCTWGTMDLKELQSNLRHYRFPPLAKSPLPYLDIQKLFSLAFEDGKSRRSLEYAVDFLHLSKDDSFHRAKSDAHYTAEIFKLIENEELLERYSFDVFHLPKDKKHELHVTFSTYSKYISRRFKDKTAALKCREVVSCRCYLCNQDTRRKIRWFTPNGGKYFLCLGICKEHGLIHGKLRIKKTEDGGVFVVKTIRSSTKEEMEELKIKAKKAIFG